MLNEPGLTTAQVLAARAQHGENRLASDSGPSQTALLLRQFASPLIYLILVAAAISFALGDYGDVAIIMVVVLANVALGFFQEYRANKTYLSLRNLVRPTASVFRDANRIELDVWQIVPGDVVVLAAGDKVPADGVLFEVTQLVVDEAILTGESVPVTKSISADADLAQVFMGTSVVAGHALMKVVATGSQTELGKIATSVLGPDDESTPLQIRLSRFSRTLTYIVMSACVIVLLVGQFLGMEFTDLARTAVMLSVAAVPEGLVIAVTVILVSGMRRILHRQGLVKRLIAVETLGSVTVICTDKTGTLTEGRMEVAQVDFVDEMRAKQVMAVCNNLQGSIDVALWQYCESIGGESPQEIVSAVSRLAEKPFSSETKYMVTAVSQAQSSTHPTLLLKGAPEVVARMCDLSADQKIAMDLLIDQWASQGLRLLGLAVKQQGTVDDTSGYSWVGLVGMNDAIRTTVPDAVRTAQQAGIRIIMVTGDFKTTAQSIAHTVGILDSGTVLESSDIESMSDDQLADALSTTQVFARVRPQDKLRIVKVLAHQGEITAMIGDGVNDAPALKQSHIGIVVGTATDVAKESADLVLLNNDFATVIAAIEEGRVVFDNIRKVVAYVLSNSFAEVFAIFIAMLLGWPAPLLVAQILWINLICDGPEDLVLGFEPKESDVMQRMPHKMDNPILSRLGASLIVAVSSLSAFFGLSMFGYYYLSSGDVVAGRSMVLATFSVGSIIYLFAYRSLSVPLWRMVSVRHNPPLIWAVASGLIMSILPFVFAPLGRLLGVTPLTWLQWLVVALSAFSLLAVVEIAKFLALRSASKKPVGTN